ncbi:hypothetical protein [Pseudomonas aeruginosa]|uniref:hypothetical protein n=1 Tax=Pseudomonas aeruginosa TaxID=287 RepID=UPI0015C5804F|nr:hypothetical protein [Pseudomonas aeruginosa]NPW33426.1 hypothetical protein [Pseudomonas aeruginosa]
MRLKKPLIFLGLILTTISAYADEPEFKVKPIPKDAESPHSARFLWLGLDWPTVNLAAMTVWVSENCKGGIAESQVKMARMVLDTTKEHPRAQDASGFVLDGMGLRHDKDACVKIRSIIKSEGPL